MSREPAGAAAALDRLLALMARLRDPERGCPWDLAQSFATIAPHTIEEAYEVAEAIRAEDFPGLRDELGDLLFQIVFYARMAEEAGHFTFAEIARGIVAKMERRHPHVFGPHALDGGRIDNAKSQTAAWENQKASERAAASGGRDASALDGVIAGLPGLARALKLQRRAARVGFDWPDIPGVLAKIVEELGEITDELADQRRPDRIEDEVGDLLFACVNLARRLEVEPESALRRANAKFELRFRAMERRLAEAGRSLESCDLEALETEWQLVKRQPLP